MGNAPPTGGVGSLAGGVAAVTLVPSQGVGTGIALSRVLSPNPPSLFPVTARASSACDALPASCPCRRRPACWHAT